MDETLDDDCGTAERFRQVAPDDDEREGRRMHASLLSRLFGDPYRPSRIGRFVMLEHIGHGGMGRVYAAYDEELDRKVAIKMLLDDELPTQAERTRFLREARALGRLSHPNVVTVHEVGESDGRIFVAMEYVQGESLRDWLGTEPDWSQVLEVFVQAGQGLVAAHRAELIHRDIKPANIMRRDDGVVKVLDFGIVRMATNRLTASMDAAPVVGSSSLSTETSSLTRTGAVMGTPAYMAPEQHQGDVVDERSDQYGFCIALWEGLTGSRPFVADDGDSMLEAKRSGPPPWPSEAPAVPRVVVEAL
ncbi:MAG: serine/threonine-protein kinase, partial [Nannocystaceae bacterium]